MGTASLAQSYWMQKAGGTTIDEAYSISIDGNSNTYSTGYFSGTATFGSTNLTASGVSDIFVTCTDKNGVFKWAVAAGGAGSCRGLAIKTDASGNSYVTGFINGSATFGSKTIVSAGLQDAFIAKYDNAGNILWVVDAGGVMSDIGNAITIDNSGNVVVTGEFAGTAKFGSVSLTSLNNNINVFTTKLDANGNFLWAQAGTGLHTDRGLGVACDASGNVYVTGQFTDTITFNNTHKTNLYDAIFLVKYNSSGSEQWFTDAGGGNMNIANAIAIDNNSNVYLTGDFTGTLSFFASPTVTLSGAYTNRIFTAKYNSNGNLLWDVSDASSNSLTAKDIAIDGSGNAYVIGNFECIMNGYADKYGQGTFNTVGYWDIFVTEYNTSGTWLWSRQIGGHKDNLGYGIAVTSVGDIFTAGSFDQDMIITSDASYIGYNSSSFFCNNSYCSDNSYGDFQSFNTAGNYDIFIAKPIDVNRQPYDFYIRNGSNCIRPQNKICINNNCPDTVQFCTGGSIYVVNNTCSQVAPDYTYTWSNGQTGISDYVTATGWYYVTETTVDGCFKASDSIYVLIHPAPAQPNISDNVGINTNATNPKPIIICADSVKLTGGGYGANKYFWTGLTKPDSTISATVTKSGGYCFNVENKFGCANYTCVSVTLDSALKKIEPNLVCTSCKHDSDAFCKGSSFTMFAYDSITNPSINQGICIPPTPGTPILRWSVIPNTVNYTPSTSCGANSFTPLDSGWYYITDTITRANLCDTLINVVHDSVYITLFPVPSISGVSIKGGGSLCPGDSTMLVAMDTNKFTWSNGSTKDTIWGKPGNAYSITSKITNAYGCSAIATANVYVAQKMPPVIAVTPTVGTICPGDSVQLVCTGTGDFSWNGPSGPIGGNSSAIYVKTPGSYYCVVSDTAYCNPILSNTVLIDLYATPYLAANPSPVLCPHDSIKLSVIASSGSTIKWLNPASAGSDSSITVKATGTYSCQIMSCGIPTTSNITVVSDNPVATITPAGPTTFCKGDSVVLNANSGMASYSWTPVGSGSASLSAFNSGEYYLTTIDNGGCTAKDSILIKVTPNNVTPPHVADTSTCPGESVTLIASGAGNMLWYSTFTGPVVATGPSFTTPSINTASVFYVATEVGGCISNRDSANVKVAECGSVYVPNVFTPNGDGQNDVFKATIEGARCFDCKIYNRWGVLIYEWSDVNAGWDGIVRQTGLPASDGTYYYIINYCSYLNVPGKRDGFLTLIRK
ncbi:MAG TPA: gliding motility-associated C-terminal domain-containing protein [Bacteroidia bacterium]|nr:gliding motility-associated C-terminal domain-containing protein [Bacteroidia bacterium]